MSKNQIKTGKIVRIEEKKIWLESDILGNKIVMAQYDDDDEPFTYCTFSYDHRFTSGEQQWDEAERVARRIGASGEIERRSRIIELPDIGCGNEQEGESSRSPNCALAWSTDLPNEQADWWWWDGDEDAQPILVSILVSGHGSQARYFASMGQHGWNHVQWVEGMGGHWMKAIIPEPPKL